MTEKPYTRTCSECQSKYSSKDPRRKFCSLKCCWKWRSRNKENLKGGFKIGSVPWNNGTTGVMKPNTGSFQKGRHNPTKQPVGTVKLRADKHEGKRAWVKVSDEGSSYDWKLRAVIVWESVNGPVPSGSVVHHKDRNKLNDVIENLELQTRAEHLTEHKHEYEERRKRAATSAIKAYHAHRRNQRRSV